MRCTEYQATNKGCRVGFFGEGSFYERPAHSRNFCHQLLFFCGGGALPVVVGCGLLEFGCDAAGLELFEFEEGETVAPDLFVEATGSSIGGGVEKWTCWFSSKAS